MEQNSDQFPTSRICSISIEEAENFLFEWSISSTWRFYSLATYIARLSERIPIDSTEISSEHNRK